MRNTPNDQNLYDIVAHYDRRQLQSPADLQNSACCDASQQHARVTQAPAGAHPSRAVVTLIRLRSGLRTGLSFDGASGGSTSVCGPDGC